MKKLILSLTGMGVAVTLIFASCQKEEVSRKSETETAQKSVNDNTEEETKVGGVTFVTQWNGNSCVKPAHRCLPEVVVTPKMIESFRVVNDNEEEYEEENDEISILSNGNYIACIKLLIGDDGYQKIFNPNKVKLYWRGSFNGFGYGLSAFCYDVHEKRLDIYEM